MLFLARGQRVLWSPLRPQFHSARPLKTPRPFLSTSAVQAARSTPSNQPSRQTVPAQAQEINAPLSTLPAEIDRPQPADPTSSTPDKLKRIVAIGRAYLTFYKTGLKNVFRNYRASLPLRAKLGLPTYLPTSPPRKVSAPQSQQPAIDLGRGQYQLVRRAARDVRRMIPFTLILVICGEFTPLIVPVFGSAITPATCRVPRQIEKDREAQEKRKFAALRDHVKALGSGSSVSDWKLGGSQEHALVDFAHPRWAESADVPAVLRACAVFGLIKSHDRFLGSALAGLLYRPRLRRYLEYLAIDDGMIRSGGGVAAMSAAEVRIACDERGACGGSDIVVRNHARAPLPHERKPRSSRPASHSEELERIQSEKHEREWLERWLQLREGTKKAQ